MSGVGSQAGTAGYRTAQRPPWSALPPSVRAAVEGRCAAHVVSAASQSAGFTPGFASRLVLDDGTRLFVKGAHEPSQAWVASSYQTEAETVRTLPAVVPAPALRWTIEVDGWFLAAYEDVEGRHPHRPWTPDDISLVLDALTQVAAVLTPAPAAVEAADYREELTSYAANLAALDPSVVRPAAARTLRTLADRVLRDAPATTLCHHDLRDDNILIDTSGQVRIVDWNYVSVGPPWLDVVGLACSIAGDGADADALLAQHPLTRGLDADLIDGTLALLYGYYVAAAAQDEVATSPWLRRHQRWYRDAIWSWLCARRGWDPREVLGAP